MVEPVVYYVADFVSGVVLGTLPLSGEVTKARGEVESASWDLAIPDERVSSPTYVETQGELLTPEVVNLSINPSFEVSVGDWTSHLGSDTPVLSVARAHSGTRSLLLARGGGTNVHWGDTALGGANLGPNATYTVSGYFWIPSANADPAGWFVSGDVVAATATTSNVRDQWVRVSHTFTTNADAVPTCTTYIRGGATGQVWLDAVMLNEGATPLDYLDGDQPGCEWLGAPHASASRKRATYSDSQRTYQRDDSWATLLEPIKTCILAEWRGKLIQGWFVLADTVGNPTVPLQGATLSRQFEKTFIRDLEFYDSDLSAIGAALITQVLGLRDGWEVQWTPCGVKGDHFWTFDQLVSVYSGLETLQAAEGGPVWDTSVDWVPGEEGRRFTKTALIGPTLGGVRPEAIFTAKPGEYTRTRDFTSDNAAFELWATTEGSGGQGITEDSWRSPKLDQGWPTWEGVVEFTDMDDEQLAARRDGTGPKIADGLVVWEATLRIEEQPILGDEWSIGDTVTLRAKPSDYDPAGAEVTAEVEGWALNTEQGTIVVGLVQEGTDDE